MNFLCLQAFNLAPNIGCPHLATHFSISTTRKEQKWQQNFLFLWVLELSIRRGQSSLSVFFIFVSWEGRLLHRFVRTTWFWLLLVLRIHLILKIVPRCFSFLYLLCVEVFQCSKWNWFSGFWILSFSFWCISEEKGHQKDLFNHVFTQNTIKKS